MSASAVRRWISAVAFFAIVLQAVFAPAGVTAPPVNLLQQLADGGGVQPADWATAPAAGVAIPAVRPPSSQPRRDSSVPICPYWCGVFAAAHVAGLAPSLIVAEIQTPPQAGARLRSVDLPASPAASELHRARAPPTAA
jgi:hypothetical protein